MKKINRNKNRGGARPGAGRPAKTEPLSKTMTIRITEDDYLAIQQMKLAGIDYRSAVRGFIRGMFANPE